MESPFIHCLKTPLGYYVYDVNTNRFLQIQDEGFYHALQKMETTGEICETYRPQYMKLRERGYLSPHRPIQMRHGMTDHLAYQLQNNIEQMTLQLTQQCNFRCSYCTYTPKEHSGQRKHSSKRMSWCVAKRAVDFFLEHSKERTDPVIGLYGGEPLLEMSLLKRIVNYANEVFDGKELKFTITTNGSLLDRERLAYFSEHPEIDIMISLDGPPAVHDRSRVFAANSKGTFDVIMSNLRVARTEFPDVFSRLKYNIVVDPRFDCRPLFEFFSDTSFFDPGKVQYTDIDTTYSDEKLIPSEEYIREIRTMYFKGYLAGLRRYPADRVADMVSNSIYSAQDKLKENLQYSHVSDSMSHGGPCTPGQRRLMIDVDGRFFPCERVSETSPIMCIGDLITGFCIEKAEALLNIAALSAGECRNCWAITHCTICCRGCEKDGAFSKAHKLTGCEEVRTSTEDQFLLYLMQNELSKER